VITGRVSDDGSPVIDWEIAGRTWTATIDTGFNGDLELPEALRSEVNPVFVIRALSLLAADLFVEEDYFSVAVEFDGRPVKAEATFVAGHSILIGTNLLHEYRLEVDFVARTVRLERVA
jgi:predicted aspartyl protease